MPVHRNILNKTTYVDIAYTGAWKYDQTSDIVLTRYSFNNNTRNPRIAPVWMPRVFGEELARDTKKNVYTSEHLAWIRPPAAGTCASRVSSSTDTTPIRRTWRNSRTLRRSSA
jgi:hypothetical protein